MCRSALLVEGLAGVLDVLGQTVYLLAAHRLLDQCTHDLHVLGVRRKRVRRNHPAPLRRELPGDVGLVVRRVVAGLEPERHQRKLFQVVADHLEATTVAQVLRKHARVLLHLLHHVGVAITPEPDEVVVLRQHHRGTRGEVQRERRVGLAEVVLVEDQVLGQVGPLPEDQPADARVDKPVLVPGHVDRPDLLELEVPLRVRVEERPDEPAARTVDVEGDVQPVCLLVEQQLVDPDDVVHVPGERRTEDRSDADGVLVEVWRDVVGADRVLALGERHDPRLDVEVATELLPHHVDVTTEDQVRLVHREVRGLPALLPLPLQGQGAEHDRLRRALGAAAGGLPRRVEEIGKHPHAALLDLRGDRVLRVVDEVGVQVLRDDPLRLRLHPRGDEGGQVALRVALHGEVLAHQAHRVHGTHAALGEVLRRRRLGEESVAEQGLCRCLRRSCLVALAHVWNPFSCNFVVPCGLVRLRRRP